jgi:hypothetical protein
MLLTSDSLEQDKNGKYRNFLQNGLVSNTSSLGLEV